MAVFLSASGCCSPDNNEPQAPITENITPVEENVTEENNSVNAPSNNTTIIIYNNNTTIIYIDDHDNKEEEDKEEEESHDNREVENFDPSKAQVDASVTAGSGYISSKITQYELLVKITNKGSEKVPLGNATVTFTPIGPTDPNSTITINKEFGFSLSPGNINSIKVASGPVKEGAANVNCTITIYADTIGEPVVLATKTAVLPNLITGEKDADGNPILNPDFLPGKTIQIS